MRSSTILGVCLTSTLITAYAPTQRARYRDARGESRMLFVAASQVSFPVPGLGLWCLDGTTLTGIPVPRFGTASRQPSLTTTFSVPAGHKGLTLYWQELRATSSGSLRTVTNCVKTTL
jgi:hypothetical protein